MSKRFCPRPAFRVLFDPCPDALSQNMKLSLHEVYYGLSLGVFVPGMILHDLRQGTTHTINECTGRLELDPPNKSLINLVNSRRHGYHRRNRSRSLAAHPRIKKISLAARQKKGAGV